MSTSELRRRPLVVLIAVLLGVLVASIVVGGAVNDGYAQSRDYVSALSARGATHAWVGVIGLLAFSGANALTARLLWTSARSVSWFLLIGAGAGVVTALARIDCPAGAARCSLMQTAPEDQIDVLHGQAVLVYALAVVIALSLAAWQVQRTAWRATFVILAVVSVTALALTTSDTPGTAQRVWLVANATALLALAMSPLGSGPTRRT